MEQIITIFKEKIKDINTEQNFIDYKNIFFKEYFGPLYDKFKTVKNEEKKELGKQINLIKQEFEKICETSLAKIINDTEMKNHIVDYDITLNTATLTKGSLHPSTLIFKKMLEWFKKYDFVFYSGNDIMDVKYNFDHLNLAENHPTRDVSETFYLSNNQYTLRSQMTSQSVFVMDNNQNEEIRYAMPGWVYRNDDNDMTHSYQFHQLDFIWVKKGLNVKNLKWLVANFCRFVFGQNTKTRFTLSNYSFTEPSFEASCTCPFCEGKGCKVCKQTGWITIGGLGIFHERVMGASKIVEKTGIAGGFGIDRMGMIKYGIDDIRKLFKNYDFKIIEEINKKGEEL